MKFICSDCGKAVEKVYDVFEDGMVLMCKDCALKRVKDNNPYKINYPKTYKEIVGE